MKHLPFLIVVCFFSSLLFAQTTTSFHGTAESATVTTNVNGTSLNLEVGRGDFLGHPVTFLSLFLVTHNADGSFTQVFGFDTIPGQAFTNAGIEQMDVNLDTSQVPNFQLTQCTVTFTPFFQSSCSAAPSGIIRVHWSNNKVNSQSILTNEHGSFAGVSMHSHRDLDESSADASGSVLGLSLPGTNLAFVQMNRDTQITITH